MLSPRKNCGLVVPQRWIFATLAFLALAIGNAMRAILSITITEMVVPINSTQVPTDETCPSSSVHVSKNGTVKIGTVYEWDEYTQGIILSSVYWGYTATQFFYGSLSERFGGKYLLGQSILIPAVLTLVTPVAIDWGGSTALIVLRVFIGVSSSAMYPVASTMVSKWAIPEDRARIGGFVFTGFILGPVLGTTLPALIILHSGMGWPAVFYFFGILGILWFPFWAFLCYDDPLEHPFISATELKYFQENLAGNNNALEKLPPAPYRHIARSKEFWAFVIGMTGCDWAYFTMASDLPKYMSSVVKLSIENNGYLSSLPYLCMWLNSIFSSWISDRILEKKWLTLTGVRKLLAMISTIGPAAFIMIASYAGCDQVVVVTAFILGMTLQGSSYPSIVVNNLDLSPNYAGTLMAIGNGIAALGGILSPYIVGLLTTNQTAAEWRLAFWIGFVVAVLTNAVFTVYGSADVQEWDDPDFTRRPKRVDKGDCNCSN
ncbi:putative inorganic phosphate cotransporter [Nasonia vitripennis]|uniref:Major facilitator superfamily (MFS) profile domain-containing protein n=1 Tax=Nasonia vitripennis TaxID=7425 RepID=A0A7M7GFH4_NASVI|nr:putative inorganic phosphate cotransporter [Nasonia vitripennis]XP_031779622.1 putative inorganic phosphate cotransporter [Nasonia vitripennis]